MARSFADYLKQFALSVDIVNADIFGELKALIQYYVKESLSVDYFEFMRLGIVDGRPGLSTLWPSEGYISNSIKDVNGIYNGQTAYAFDKGVSLWVVDKNKAPLAATSAYVDLWSGKTDLPEYHTPRDVKEDIRTAIMIPLRENARVIGLLDFESSRYIGITEAAKKELCTIAESISMLYSLERINYTQRMSTKDALHELERTLKSKHLPRLSKPKLFLAFSSRADDQVIGTIQQVLSEYEDKLDLVAWDAISKTGNINTQIVDDILSSKYGICYFSEPVQESGGQYRYRDNPNVLIEAGMLHALYHADSESTEGWIPIREPNSPPPPFDFVAERRLDVIRKTDGELNEHQFKSVLRKRINSLINA